MGFLASDTILWGTRTTSPNKETPREANRAHSGSSNPSMPPAITSNGGPANDAIHMATLRVLVIFGDNVLSLMKKVMSTGTIVMAKIDEAAMAKVLV